jgi:hypothetical protein
VEAISSTGRAQLSYVVQDRSTRWIDRHITPHGPIDDEHRAKLAEIAEKTPVAKGGARGDPRSEPRSTRPDHKGVVADHLHQLQISVCTPRGRALAPGLHPSCDLTHPRCVTDAELAMALWLARGATWRLLLRPIPFLITTQKRANLSLMPAKSINSAWRRARMADLARRRIAIVDEDGRPVATADIDDLHPSVARVSLHVESGHLPTGTRKRLVDAILDAPEVSSRQRLQVALPLGDTEMLDRVRERCDTVETRAAGATCLIDADLPDPGQCHVT